MHLRPGLDPAAFCEAFVFPDDDDAHLHQQLIASGRLDDVVAACLAKPPPAGRSQMILLDGDGWPPHHLVEPD